MCKSERAKGRGAKKLVNLLGYLEGMIDEVIVLEPSRVFWL